MALHVPDGHAAEPDEQPPPPPLSHVLVSEFHVPEAQSQPAKFAEDEEPVTHWPVHALTGEPLALIAVAW